MDELDLGQTIRGFAAGQRLFDRYILKEILGRGGMGIVWRAFDEQLERDVALKFLPELVAFDEQAIKDLKRETKRAQELRHHHIVQVYDFVADKQHACISMECVEGPSLSALKARSEKGFFEMEEIKPWIAQLCEALTYAHERAHVVHRDLKPANLMLDRNSELKITDFGIARSVTDSVSMLTHARGGTSGTLVYMSPQQLAGERPSYSDDIYSVGVCIFELLTGKPPFYTGDVTDQIKHATPPSMQKRREQLELNGSNIPNQWETTVAACLSKDPARRPRDARELALRLGIGVAALPKSTVAAAVPAPSNRRPADLIIGLVVLVLCGAVAGWWFGIEQPKRAKLITAEAQRQKEQNQAKAAEDKKAFDEKVKSAAAAQLAEEKRKADEAAAAAKAAEQRKKEEAARAGPAGATKEHPWENSLAMKFVPVPISGGPTSGKPVLFSTCLTRVKDFATFVDESKYDMKKGEAAYTVESASASQPFRFRWLQAGGDWRNPHFPSGAKQTDDHPVVCVSWNDAITFCRWLTEREQKSGRLPAGWSYRLPSDHEWSCAVGLGDKEDAIKSPQAKRGKITGVYPWGKQWPPPHGIGNFAGEEFRVGATKEAFNVIKGYNDGAPRTSSVAQYGVNDLGLYDMAGNAWEWCADEPAVGEPFILRGGSWSDYDPDKLLSSFRSQGRADERSDHNGFRCVLTAEPALENQSNPSATKRPESSAPVAPPSPTPAQPKQSFAGVWTGNSAYKWIYGPGTQAEYWKVSTDEKTVAPRTGGHFAAHREGDTLSWTIPGRGTFHLILTGRNSASFSGVNSVDTKVTIRGTLKRQ